MPLITYLRDEYENVAFLYVSDDMTWGKKNIKNKKKDLVRSELKVVPENAFYINFSSLKS